MRDEQGQLIHLTGIPLSEHLARLAHVRSVLLEGYRGFYQEHFQRLFETPDYLLVSPEYVLHHLLQHEAVHHSQIEALHYFNRMDKQ